MFHRKKDFLTKNIKISGKIVKIRIFCVTESGADYSQSLNSYLEDFQNVHDFTEFFDDTPSNLFSLSHRMLYM